MGMLPNYCNRKRSHDLVPKFRIFDFRGPDFAAEMLMNSHLTVHSSSLITSLVDDHMFSLPIDLCSSRV